MKPRTGTKAFAEAEEACKKLMKNYQKAMEDAIIYGRGWSFFPKDDKPPLEKNGGIYSGILGKYINPKTGEPIEDTCEK